MSTTNQTTAELTVTHWYPAQQRGTALLIHGLGGTSLHWEKIALHLADLGYHVIAPNLSGHGDSPRKQKYTIQAWVEEVINSIQGEHVDLIMGHSLGGIIASGVSTQLTYEPRQIIMVDPAWYFPPAPLGWFVQLSLRGIRRYTAKHLHRQNPTWSGRDINIELNSIKAWDPDTVRGLTRHPSQKILKRYLRTHHNLTTIVKQSHSLLVTRPRRVQLQKRGVRVVTLPNLSHNLHRDDTALFLRAIQNLVHFPENHFTTLRVEPETAVELA